MSGLLQARLTSVNPRRARIALAGCGTVGGSLIRLLRERRASVEREQGLHFDMVGVLVRDLRRPRIVESAAGVVTNDLRAWLEQDADVVVEATGARDTALQIARATLARGRRFITANKALVAAHGPELSALARSTGGRLHFEAAVGGGVPVIRVLREALRHTGVRAIRGVLNGTSNYVLTRMAEGEPLVTIVRGVRVRNYTRTETPTPGPSVEAPISTPTLAPATLTPTPPAVAAPSSERSDKVGGALLAGGILAVTTLAAAGIYAGWRAASRSDWGSARAARRAERRRRTRQSP